MAQNSSLANKKTNSKAEFAHKEAATPASSVVLKAVPPGATAVGIPARVIVEEDDKRREEQAAKMGFSAYAVTQGVDDPLATALHRLIDHVAEQDRSIEHLQAALQKLGARVNDQSEPLDAGSLNRMVD